MAKGKPAPKPAAKGKGLFSGRAAIKGAGWAKQMGKK